MYQYYSGQVGHAQVPIIQKNSSRVRKFWEEEQWKRRIPCYCFLGSCLPLWSLIHLTDVCGLDTTHTISCYFTTLFPHPRAACILPNYPALVPQILLYHLFLPTKACLDCCSSKKPNPCFFQMSQADTEYTPRLFAMMHSRRQWM